MPAALDPLHGYAVIEMVEDFLTRQPEGVEKGRRQQFAPAVDAHVDQVLAVEFEIEPRAAIRNDSGREQELARRMGLALVMIEKYTRRTVHLADNHALGAIDDKSSIVGHQRHIAHIDVLLLDAQDRTGFGVFVNVKDHELQGHPQGRRVGHAALLAFLNVVFGRFEGVAHIFERRRIREIGYWKNRLQSRFEARGQPRFFAPFRIEELIEGTLLHRDKVWHRGGCLDQPEVFPHPLPIGKRGFHASSSLNLQSTNSAVARLSGRPGEIHRYPSNPEEIISTRRLLPLPQVSS